MNKYYIYERIWSIYKDCGFDDLTKDYPHLETFTDFVQWTIKADSWGDFIEQDNGDVWFVDGDNTVNCIITQEVRNLEELHHEVIRWESANQQD